MNGRKRQRRRRTGSGDVVHVLIMYHVSQAVSFIAARIMALGRSRHRLVLDTKRNEIHIGEVLPFWRFDAACHDLRKIVSNCDYTKSYFMARYFIPRTPLKCLRTALRAFFDNMCIPFCILFSFDSRLMVLYLSSLSCQNKHKG